MTTRSQTSIVGAALWMGGTLLSFTVMAVAIRELSGRYGLFEVLFLRQAIGLLVLSGIIIAGGKGWGVLRTSRPRLQLWRNAIHFVGQIGWMAGIALLPLAAVFALEFTTPIWSAIIATVLLREQVTRPRAVMIGLGFAGVLVLLDPTRAVIDVTAFFVLAAALCYAFAYIATKQLTRTDPPISILFWMCALQAPFALALAVLPDVAPSLVAPPVLRPWVYPQIGDAPAILALGLGALSAHFCITRALALADATVVVPLDFLRLPLVAVVAAALYGEPLELSVFLGGAIIVFGAWFGLRGERRKAPA